MAKAFTIRTDTSGINGAFDAIESEMYAAARVAAQAGAQVLYDKVQQNVLAIGVKTGNLKNSIYQVFDKEASVKVGTFAGRDLYSRATYSVSWRTARTGTGTIAPHGALIEYGYLQRYASYINKKANGRLLSGQRCKASQSPGATHRSRSRMLTTCPERTARFSTRPGHLSGRQCLLLTAQPKQ